MIWAKLKDAAIRAGCEPWLRPIVEKLRGQELEEDDVAARVVISRLASNAVCVDIGCHKGKFLDPMRRAAPDGRFFAFEPIPYLHDLLKSKYRTDRRVQVFNLALSSADGNAAFFINERDMGLSGLSQRPARMGQDRLTKVPVAVRSLDGVLGNPHVDFIKIDVEGAEFDVLQGARQTIVRSRPVILFEFGLGGADYFGVDAATMHDFFSSLDYALYTVDDFAYGREALSLVAFKSCFELNSKYNFVASPCG
jgi:FkbM family methyltransferase